GKMLAIYLHFMKGTPYIYQGEEIGMINYPIQQIQEVDDVESLRMYNERLEQGYPVEELIQSINAKGRDNARHPMQWDTQRNAGFSTENSWLPVHPNYLKVNAEAALTDKHSLFYTYKQLIQLRKQVNVIVNGGYQVVETKNPLVLAYQRMDEKEVLTIVVNFSDIIQQYQLPTQLMNHEMLIHNYPENPKQWEQLSPYEAYAVRQIK
ncbi:MAG: alpha-amylase family glycosyl hydrolase, partial [Enterococcus sp.]